MTLTMAALYVAALVAIAAAMAAIRLLREFGPGFALQIVAMAATAGDHLQRFVRRGVAGVRRGRTLVAVHADDWVRSKRGLLLLAPIPAVMWGIASLSAGLLDHQLLAEGTGAGALFSVLGSVLLVFAGLVIGAVVGELVFPVRFPWLDASEPRQQRAMVMALLVLLPALLALQLTLAKNRADTFRGTELAKIETDRRLWEESLKVETDPLTKATLQTQIDSATAAAELVEAKAKRLQQTGTFVGLSASFVEIATGFAVPLAAAGLVIAALWFLDVGLGALAGAIGLGTLLVRALPGLVRRRRPAAAPAVGVPAPVHVGPVPDRVPIALGPAPADQSAQTTTTPGAQSTPGGDGPEAPAGSNTGSGSARTGESTTSGPGDSSGARGAAEPPRGDRPPRAAF